MISKSVHGRQISNAACCMCSKCDVKRNPKRDDLIPHYSSRDHVWPCSCVSTLFFLVRETRILFARNTGVWKYL